MPRGSKVLHERVQGYTKLVGAGSIYAITPCTEEAAHAAVRAGRTQPLRLLELPAAAQIEGPADPSDGLDSESFLRP